MIRKETRSGRRKVKRGMARGAVGGAYVCGPTDLTFDKRERLVENQTQTKKETKKKKKDKADLRPVLRSLSRRFLFSFSSCQFSVRVCLHVLCSFGSRVASRLALPTSPPILLLHHQKKS